MANIVRYDPFDELTRLQREMSRLFDDNFRTPARGGDNGGSAVPGRTVWAPVVDVREDENEILVHAELPGVKLDDIDIEVTGDTLTLRGERKIEEKTEDSKHKYVRVERAYGSFQRTFTLGVPIQSDQVRAEFKDGVLTIRLPKSEAIKPKKVLVSSNS